jgi:hypothetical protein
MAVSLVGIDCKLYVNTGTYASPTWVEVVDAKDVTMSDTRAEGDSSVRGFGMASVTPGQRTIQITFDIRYDNDAAAYEAIKAAYEGRTVMGVLLSDGPRATAGVEGFRLDTYVTDLTKNEPMNDVKTASAVLSGTTDGGREIENYLAA